MVMTALISLSCTKADSLNPPEKTVVHEEPYIKGSVVKKDGGSFLSMVNTSLLDSARFRGTAYYLNNDMERIDEFAFAGLPVGPGSAWSKRLNPPEGAHYIYVVYTQLLYNDDRDVRIHGSGIDGESYFGEFSIPLPGK